MAKLQRLADALDVSPEHLLGGPPPPPVYGPVMPRDTARGRRKRIVRARTISVKRMTLKERNRLRAEYPDTDHWRPATRADCAGIPRPCLYIGCKYNLFVDVMPDTGAIKLNFPDLKAWEMGESCTLDVADRGGTVLEDVGEIINVTRERIRQIEVAALENLMESKRLQQLADERAGWEGARCPVTSEL